MLNTTKMASNVNAISDNGHYSCQYEYGRLSDGSREIKQFRLFEGDLLMYTIDRIPGSDPYISNSGVVAIFGNENSISGNTAIHCYSKYGEHLISKEFINPSMFSFSQKGNKFGVRTSDGLHVVSAMNGETETYEKGCQYHISENENLIAIAVGDAIKIYSEERLLREIKTNFSYTRDIKISFKHDIVVAIDKQNMKAYSIQDGAMLFSADPGINQSYRDLIIKNGKLIVGIQYRDESTVKGILRIYGRDGNILSNEVKSTFERKKSRKSDKSNGTTLEYPEIPWPFSPNDSMPTIWNYYEQHMGGWGPNYSYLHEGLDVITPIAEPVYAVRGGIVKCVFTLMGYYHWSIAVSDSQVEDYSDGWMYGHLIENTIQFQVGDTVQDYDYLGDIVQWYSNNWGHLHFVEVRDSGLVWYHDDENEMGLNYNPLLSLRPNTDTIPPAIEDVFGYSKFGFCINETSDYLNPDSLYGDIDIIVKVNDYIGDSEWTQPAFELYYWVNSLPDGDTVFQRTFAQILNHSYPFFNLESYATLLYKRDNFLYPSDWMDMNRRYHHILTNNNGDSLAELWEAGLAFPTNDYANGNYRIFVEAFDAYGNSTIDSQDVYFYNTTSKANEEISDKQYKQFTILNNYPNPFNASTTIEYGIPEPGRVRSVIYDLLGRQVHTLLDEDKRAGGHTVTFDASGFPSGVYFYRIQAGEFAETRKMILLK